VSRLNLRCYAISHWIDTAPQNLARTPEELRWGRIAKIAEEAGEVVAAMIGATGQNPRKGVTGGMRDVERELLDVALTALAAVAHLRADDPEPPDVLALLEEHAEFVARRAGLGGPA
jgi:hypothetical protein